MHEEVAGAERADAGSDRTSQDVQPEGVSTVPLNTGHITNDFESRSARVQQFIRADCWSMISSNYTRVFVWEAPNSNRILGFYSLSASNVERAELVSKHSKRTPEGIPAPVALIGYLGKSKDAPARFGEVLIHDAARRAASITGVAFWGLCLHAENEDLARYYADLGFTAAKRKPLFMYAPFSALGGSQPKK